MSGTTKRVLGYVGVVVVVFTFGVVMAAVGNLLRDPLCIGGGSECSGVRPISKPAGAVLVVAGSVIAVGSPVIVLAGARIARGHPRRDE